MIHTKYTEFCTHHKISHYKVASMTIRSCVVGIRIRTYPMMYSIKSGH